MKCSSFSFLMCLYHWMELWAILLFPSQMFRPVCYYFIALFAPFINISVDSSLWSSCYSDTFRQFFSSCDANKLYVKWITVSKDLFQRQKNKQTENGKSVVQGAWIESSPNAVHYLFVHGVLLSLMSHYTTPKEKRQWFSPHINECCLAALHEPFAYLSGLRYLHYQQPVINPYYDLLYPLFLFTCHPIIHEGHFQLQLKI